MVFINEERRIDQIVKQADHYTGVWSNTGDYQTDLTDILADLRHWADARDIDFYKALDKSYQHYCNEKHSCGQCPGTRPQPWHERQPREEKS